MKKKDLPLSPHLQIYKPQITSILSIAHRISGFCLNFMLIFTTVWVVCLAVGEIYYNFIVMLFNFLLIKILFFIGVLGFCYHALNGIRHILWDFGFFLENNSSRNLGIAVIFLALILSFTISHFFEFFYEN